MGELNTFPDGKMWLFHLPFIVIICHGLMALELTDIQSIHLSLNDIDDIVQILISMILLMAPSEFFTS